MMSTDFVQQFPWPVFWAEFGGIITFVPVLFMLIFAGVAAMPGNPALRNLFAGALGFGAWLSIMGFATFLMDKTRR